MLTQLQLLQPEDIDPFLKQFDALDADGSGMLDHADLELLASERARRRGSAHADSGAGLNGISLRSVSEDGGEGCEPPTTARSAPATFRTGGLQVAVPPDGDSPWSCRSGCKAKVSPLTKMLAVVQSPDEARWRRHHDAEEAQPLGRRLPERGGVVGGVAGGVAGVACEPQGAPGDPALGNSASGAQTPCSAASGDVSSSASPGMHNRHIESNGGLPPRAQTPAARTHPPASGVQGQVPMSPDGQKHLVA
eukprot:3731630-Prymnesium_polylepis.1